MAGHPPEVARGLLLATIQLAIDLAPTLPHLADWWQTHQQQLRRLPPHDLAAAVYAKDARKRALQMPSDQGRLI